MVTSFLRHGLRALALIAALSCTQAAQAGSYVFSGTDAGGTGSATVDFDFSGNVVTITVNNTSPTLLDDLSGDNAPGITGLGFDFLTNGSLTSWRMDAEDANGGPVQINDTSNFGVDGGSDWWTLSNPGNFGGPWTFDYVPETGQIKGALYNPDAVGSSALAALPNYFTTATLLLTFDDVVTGLNPDTLNNPTVRMQNVGANGAGSLKLTGVPDDGPDPSPSVPEPSSFLLLGIGGIALVGYGARRRKLAKKAA